MLKLAKKIDILHKSGKTVFSINDLALYWGVESKSILYVHISRAKEKNLLKSIYQGLYSISEIEIDHFELAGSLKKNSYISFETVLAQESIINQWYGTYFSASDRKLEINIDYGKFNYRRMPTEILNNRLGVINKENYFIATPERAVCDYFYKVGFQQLDDIDELDKNKLLEISKIYENKRLENDIQKLNI